ncbi:hypothetical protein NDU88_004993 [Pleurodeles waltl]|uniref:Uncharacterized protein n=1 Tax=Pleurodeles waltl TaxID=8319 RepID=A0AAV7QDK3_PLEWA|nr:hypothetical protein NDU88_004993 [Pleurodeles waltl]
MTYDAEGVINIRIEDGRERSGKKKEEPRTRGSRSEEIAIGASEEERETVVAGRHKHQNRRRTREIGKKEGGAENARKPE